MTESPSLAEEMQRLLKLGQEISGGSPDRIPELQALASSQMMRVLGMRDALIARIGRVDPAFQDQLADGLAAVEKAYQTHLASLDALDVCCAEPQAEELARCLGALPASASEVTQVTAWVEAHALTLGPSRFPEVNLAMNLVEGLRGSWISPAEYQERCSACRSFYQGIVDELDAQKRELPAGIAERKVAATALIKAWDGCRQLTASSSTAAVDAVVNQISRGHLDLESAQTLFLTKTFAEAPTGSREANWIIHAGKGVIEKRYPATVLRSFVTDMLARTRNALPELEAAVNDEKDEATLAATEEAMTATITVEGCLSQLDEEANRDQPSPERLGAQLKEFEEAIGWLVKAGAALKECERMKGQVSCPRCQAYNSSTRRTCQSCNATLPQVAGLGTVPSVGILEGSNGGARGPLITRSLVDLNELIIAFERGEVRGAELVARLAPYEGVLTKAEQGLGKYKIPQLPESATAEEREKAQGFIDLAGETLALVLGGTQLCRTGLDEMRHGARAIDRQAVRDGYRSYFEGVQEISRAGDLRETFDNLLQSELKKHREQEESKRKPDGAPEEVQEDEEPSGLV